MFASAPSSRPVVFASEEEIPPWFRGGRVVTPAAVPAEAAESAASPGSPGAPGSPGFRALDPVVQEGGDGDDADDDTEELVALHRRLKRRYEACREGGDAAIECFLCSLMDEEYFDDYLEWQPSIADFIQRRTVHWQRTTASDKIRRLAGLVLKAFFTAPMEWE